MHKYWFTFGHGHHDENHESLGKFYTTIVASSDRDARIQMCELRNDHWSMVYDNPGVCLRYNLTYLDFNRLTKQHGEDK